jgi:hypothetical protein
MFQSWGIIATVGRKLKIPQTGDHTSLNKTATRHTTLQHTGKKILLLSPYDIASHRYWWQGLTAQLAEHQWTVLTLPPRYFSWRMRGNSLSWAFSKRNELRQHYDLIIACAMTDLSSLRGFVPELANTPSIVYCHENQFAFPQSEQQQGSVELQMVQLYSFLCANKVVFNSQFNQRSFFEGAEKLLKKLPDEVPANLLAGLQGKSTVIPVPLTNIPRPHQAKRALIVSGATVHRRCTAVFLFWKFFLYIL